MANARSVIEQLNLEKHPEGGWFRQTYQSPVLITSSNQHDGTRHASTAIFYLLEGDDFSAFHRLKSDEIWHFYYGSSITLYVIDKHRKIQTYLLGNSLLDGNAAFQVTIPAHHWFAAEVNDKSSFSLIGCTVTPGFEYYDFELANGPLLSEQYSEHTHLINRLTRHI